MRTQNASEMYFSVCRDYPPCYSIQMILGHSLFLATYVFFTMHVVSVKGKHKEISKINARIS